MQESVKATPENQNTKQTAAKTTALKAEKPPRGKPPKDTDLK